MMGRFTSQKGISIYIAQALLPLPHMANVWLDAPLNQKIQGEIFSLTYKLSRLYFSKTILSDLFEI